MMLVFTVYRSQWTAEFASASPAGLGKAVTPFAWVEERVRIVEFATVILSKAGEVMFAKFLGALVSVKTALVMGTVIVPYTNARATLGGRV